MVILCKGRDTTEGFRKLMKSRFGKYVSHTGVRYEIYEDGNLEWNVYLFDTERQRYTYVNMVSTVLGFIGDGKTFDGNVFAFDFTRDKAVHVCFEERTLRDLLANGTFVPALRRFNNR